MKVSVEELSPVVRRVTVELEPETVGRTLDRIYNGLSRSVKIKGFRPGKVPRRILEQYYRGEVEREAVEQLVRDSYPEVIDTQALAPVAEPEVENDKLVEGQPFRYRARVEVKPQIAIKDYIGLKLQRQSAEVSAADLAAELEKLRQSLATLVPVEERKVAIPGDWAIVDYDMDLPKSPGKKIDLERNRDQPVELTEGAITQGHILELRGLEVGQNTDVHYTFPDDYKIADLRGEPAIFHVTLKGLRRREVPELDDELVKDLDEPELATLDQLRERIRTRLAAERQEAQERDLREQIEKALSEKNPFEMPPSLVARVAEADLRRLAQQIVRAGIDPKTVSLDQEKLKAATEQRIRAELLLEAVAEQEKLEVTDAEFTTALEKMAQETGVPLSKVKAQYAKPQAKASFQAKLREDKALAFLTARANIDT